MDPLQSRATVSIIVPTTGERKRSRFLERAIASILSQQGTGLDVIVVVNGDRSDRQVVDWLRNNPKLRVLTLAEGNVSAARHLGVLQAKGDFFCFVDDDDELLEDSLRLRVRLLQQHTDAVVLITNGLIHTTHDTPQVSKSLAARISRDPGGSLLVFNYFASPAALFRSRDIEPELFDIQHRYFEWTYLFFLLISKNKTLRYEDCLTYRLYDNTSSVSKTDDYLLAYPEFLVELQKLPIDPSIRHALGDKYLSALHSVSNLHLAQGRFSKAWMSHFKCLANGGWRYLPHTRHLIVANLQRISRASQAPLK